jgi:hypothetical protein
MTLRNLAHVQAARPVHLGILKSARALSFASLLGGAYATYKGTVGDTILDLFGAHLKTTHVGIAFMGIGLVTFLLSLRAILRSVERLAAIPPEK